MIRVTAGGAIAFTGGSYEYNSAQLGNGGYKFDGDHQGDIVVDAASVTFLGGSYNYSYAQLGHGGYYNSGGHSGDITVTTTGAGLVTFTGGTDSTTYAQLGHGGYNSYRRSTTSGSNRNDQYTPGTHSGNIEVTAGGDIVFTAGGDVGSTTSYAQLGHGGYGNAAIADEGHEGTITVLSGGMIDFTAGNDSKIMEALLLRSAPSKSRPAITVIFPLVPSGSATGVLI